MVRSMARLLPGQDFGNYVCVLRIHFTTADVARTRVAAAPDPLWEVVLSLHVLQSRRNPAWHQEWQTEAIRRLTARGIAGEVRRVLFPLAPVASYFPDFLTPAEAADGVDAGIDAVVSTPSRVMSEQFALMASRTLVPGWAQALASEDRDLRLALGHILRSYYDAVLAESMGSFSRVIDADRGVRVQSMVNTGVDGLLSSLWPVARWVEPTLIADYPRDLSVHLGGRGLVLIPSFFCSRAPVALVDPHMQPVLVYPAVEWATATVAHAGGPATESLERLLGATRAAVLFAIRSGVATKNLAGRVGVSPATVSHHTTVLRDAGLITSRRVVNTVVHTVTPLGAQLFDRPTGVSSGSNPRPRRWREHPQKAHEAL